RLERLRTIKGAAQRGCSLEEPFATGPPGVDLNGTAGDRPKTLGGHAERCSRSAPHRIVNHPQAGVADAHARVRQRLPQVQRSIELDRAAQGCLIPHVLRAVSSWASALLRASRAARTSLLWSSTR